MCGIVGIVQQENCFTELYDALIMLQHRGQDAAGMTVCENGHLHSRKSKGLVKEVFGQQHFETVEGHIWCWSCKVPDGWRQFKRICPTYVCKFTLWHSTGT